MVWAKFIAALRLVLPLVIGFFDVVETTTILFALTIDPVAVTFSWLGYATAAKWTFAALTLVVLLNKARAQVGWFPRKLKP